MNWKGYTWIKRTTSGAPMYNNQWDSANVTDPDAMDYIRLKISNPTSNSPYGAEIFTSGATFGYGTYYTVVERRLDNINKAVVFGGLFTYDSGVSVYHNEIDICEVSAWGGGASQTDPVQIGHVFWKDVASTNTSVSNVVNMPSDVVHTHRMTWGVDQLVFESFKGEGIGGELIMRTIQTVDIPTPASEQVHFNIWVFDSEVSGSADPATVPETEVIIRDFQFTPLEETYTSATQVAFTVQRRDRLPAGSYNWRARAADPSGSNTWGSWTSSRSFTIDYGIKAGAGAFAYAGQDAGLTAA